MNIIVTRPCCLSLRLALALLLMVMVVGPAACGDDDGGGSDAGVNGNDAQVNAVCGNGTREGNEECDEGSLNSDSTPDACRTSCRDPRCGDGVVDSGEECDEGAANSDGLPDACRTTCHAATCGDGVIDPGLGETCDDANLSPGDGCDENCVAEACGNGVVQGDEVCDDGNRSGGDGCSADCLSNESCGNNYVDGAAGESCDDGGWENGDGCSSTCSFELLLWWEFNTFIGNANIRERPCMAFDRSRGRTVLFGGLFHVGSTYTYYNDTFEQDGYSWAHMNPTQSPPGRERCTMTYDEERQVVVMHGGSGATGFNDTWEYDGTTWTNTTPVGAKPSVRMGPAMAYDAARGLVVLFGGMAGTYLSDTWEYDGTTWTLRSTTTHPPGLYQAAMGYDRVRERMVLFGGKDQGGADGTNQTWEYDGADWSLMSPATSPPLRTNGTLAYDEHRGTLVLYGGQVIGLLKDTWEYDGVDWEEQSLAAAPIRRTDHQMVYDSARRGVLLFGGTGDAGPLWDTWFLRLLTPNPNENCVSAGDEDLDGLADCDDPDCADEPACAACGDAYCSAAESCTSCAADCCP